MFRWDIICYSMYSAWGLVIGLSVTTIFIELNHKFKLLETIKHDFNYYFKGYRIQHYSDFLNDQYRTFKKVHTTLNQAESYLSFIVFNKIYDILMYHFKTTHKKKHYPFVTLVDNDFNIHWDNDSIEITHLLVIKVWEHCIIS